MTIANLHASTCAVSSDDWQNILRLSEVIEIRQRKQLLGIECYPMLLKYDKKEVKSVCGCQLNCGSHSEYPKLVDL